MKVQIVHPLNIFFKIWISSEADKPATGKPYKPRYTPKPKVEETAEIWFDDVDEVLLEGRVHQGEEKGESSNPEKYLVKENSFGGLTKIVGIDCEMVGIGRGNFSDDRGKAV